MIKILSALLIVLSLQSSLYAGYVIKTKEVYEGVESFSIIYVQDNKLRFNDEETDVIIDFDRDKIIMILNNEGFYMEESISGLEKKVIAFRDKLIEEMLQQMPEDQREQARASYEQMMGSTGEAYEGEVEVKSGGEKERIAGYMASRYEVYDDGENVESVWIADDLKVFDMKKVNEVFKTYVGMTTYEDTDAYMELMEKGMILKSIDAYDGTLEEVVEVEKMDIPRSRFEAPDGLQKLNFEEFNSMMMNAGEEDY
ncbi:MAG: DUF4412 domain-containing protein [Bacteroidota bacterium]|nr:DUF4412 domain-containing protein [Bacteroidota bacterium]